ncbi:MAG: hypothetical protein R3D29_11950 [Nitratireductor sp.]
MPAGLAAPSRPCNGSRWAAFSGLNFGWEHPLWFAADGERARKTIGFTRQNWWKPVGREVAMLREQAGIYRHFPTSPNIRSRSRVPKTG